MRARACIAVDADRDVTLASDPPITVRRSADAVYLVASGAGPLAGDDLAITVRVGAGAALAVRSAAATLALPGPAGARPSVLRVDACVGPDATLDWRPEPLVAAAGCDHVTEVALTIASGARVVWREELVLGRSGEAPGRATLRLRVDGPTGPVLRHDLMVGDPAASHTATAALGAARVVGSLLLVDPAAPAPAPAVTRDGATEVLVAPLASGATLVSALGRDAVAVRRALDRLTPSAPQRF